MGTGEPPVGGQVVALAQDNAELLSLAQEAGQLGLFEWLVRAGTVRLSPKLLELYGLTAFDGQYHTWLQCLFQEDVVRIVNEVETAFAAQAREWQSEFRLVRKSDQLLRWMESRNVLFYDANGTPTRVVGVNADVTERKRALVQLRAFTETLEERVKERTRQLETENQARQRAEALLRQAQKMEAVGQLTGGIAHDFNNLLTIVLGGLEIIGKQLELIPASAAAARIGRARDMALHGVHRAGALTERLLAFSRQQPLTPEPIEANRLVANMAEILQRTMGEAVALETVLAAGLWRTYADAHQLENALLNLVLNARDAMPAGGKATIETANCYLDDEYLSGLPEPVAPGQYVMIAVADTGVGMDKATVERAFEPFFTTKEIGKGTGLGLSQVYGFVRQSSGNVRIYSERDEGTTVKIYLPRFTGAEADQARDERATQTTGVSGGETILLVEDDDALRAYSADMLKELGYRVLAASHGAAALALSDREKNIDLLFTDVVMPGGMNGRQLAEEMLHRRPELKVLFTSGYARNAIVHHGRLDSDVELIGKPYSQSDLSRRIRSILDRDPSEPALG